MDGQVRVFDIIFIERLWRTVKYEDVYLKGYQSARDAHTDLSMYFEFYNIEQCHSSLEDQTPNEVFFKECMQYKP